MDLEPTTISQAHPETLDFLSAAWCNFAVQAFQTEPPDQTSSLALHDNSNSSSSIKSIEYNNKPTYIKMQKSMSVDDSSTKTIPPWKSNDVKSWIWMQQAMHPELNYNKKKWVSWNFAPLMHLSIKKWLKEMKQKRKDEQRLQRAEVHAAISVAGVAAALAAIAAENSICDGDRNTTRESAVATAAALVAAQCVKVAEALGAKKERLSSVISSAMSGTSASDVVTLTAAANTSLRGAATLKARRGCKNKLNGGTPVLPIEGSHDFDFEFEKGKLILSKGAKLPVETSDGKFLTMLVSIIQNDESKVILTLRKCNVFRTLAKRKESIVLDLHAELYKDSEVGEAETGYLIVLTTKNGMIKIDMMGNYERYRTWSITINHMLMLSASCTI